MKKSALLFVLTIFASVLISQAQTQVAPKNVQEVKAVPVSVAQQGQPVILQKVETAPAPAKSTGEASIKSDSKTSKSSYSSKKSGYHKGCAGYSKASCGGKAKAGCSGKCGPGCTHSASTKTKDQPPVN